MTRTSLARTATWLAAGRGIVAVFALALPIILARTLSQTNYGLYKQVELAAVLMLPFMLAGFDKSITFFVPRREQDAVTEVSTPVVTLLGIAAVILAFALLAPETFGRLLGTAPIRLLAGAAAVYAVASAMQMVGARALVAIDETKSAAILPVAIGVPRTLTLVGVVLVNPTLTALLWVILAFASASVIGWTGLLVSKKCLRAAFDRAVLKRHFRYGGTLALGTLLNAWGIQLDNYLVASTLPPAMFAIYRVGRLRVPFLPIFSRSLVDATAPRYSRLESEKRYVEMAALWRLSLEVLLPVGILLSALLASTAHWSVPLAYPDYQASVPIFRVFAFAILLESLGGIEQVLRALAALRFLLVSTIVALVVRIAVGLFVLEHGPLWLLTLAQLLVSLGLISARILFIHSRLGVSWSALIPGRALLVAILRTGLGLAATLAIGTYLHAPDWVRLLAAAPVWGALLLWTLWSQGLIRRIVPARFFPSRWR